LAGSRDGVKLTASFHRPYGIAIDQRNGDMFVPDYGGHTIRKITQQGLVGTIAGKDGVRGFQDGHASSALFWSPAGLFFDVKERCLYIADSGNNRIRKLEMQTGMVSTIAGITEKGYQDGDVSVAKFSDPCGVTLFTKDKAQSILVADSANNKIRKIQLEDGKVTVKTIAGSAVGSRDGKSLLARFNCPLSLCVHPFAPICFVADTQNNTIRQLQC